MVPFSKCVLAGSLAALSVACANNPPEEKANAYASGYSNPEIVDPKGRTQILVTFEDERVGRAPMGDATDSYRRRGSYSNSTYGGKVAERLAERYHLKQVAQWPITTLGVHCIVYDLPEDRPADQAVEEIRKDPQVESVQTMRQFSVLSESYSDPYYKLQAGLSSMHVSQAHQMATGKDIKVAVIDTGVDTHHPDLAGQILSSRDLVPGSSNSAEDIHGTAVAGGIAASANNGRGIVGVAPKAKIIALKACWQESPRKPEAICNSFTLALALNTAIEAKSQIINMSLSGPNDPLLQRMIEKANQDGIIVVASEPSKLGKDNDFPASMNQVIAVSSLSGQQTGGQPSGSKKILAAPGQEVLTTLPHDTYNFMSGSSFAAAHVSGLIALMMEVKPDLTPAQANESLERAMTVAANSSGTGRLDACSVVASLGKQASGCVSAAPITIGDNSHLLDTTTKGIKR
jgi:subtilisin family serine protease